MISLIKSKQKFWASPIYRNSNETIPNSKLMTSIICHFSNLSQNFWHSLNLISYSDGSNCKIVVTKTKNESRRFTFAKIICTDYCI